MNIVRFERCEFRIMSSHAGRGMSCFATVGRSSTARMQHRPCSRRSRAGSALRSPASTASPAPLTSSMCAPTRAHACGVCVTSSQPQETNHMFRSSLPASSIMSAGPAKPPSANVRAFVHMSMCTRMRTEHRELQLHHLYSSVGINRRSMHAHTHARVRAHARKRTICWRSRAERPLKNGTASSSGLYALTATCRHTYRHVHRHVYRHVYRHGCTASSSGGVFAHRLHTCECALRCVRRCACAHRAAPCMSVRSQAATYMHMHARVHTHSVWW